MAAAICRGRRAGRTDGNTETRERRRRERWMKDRERGKTKERGEKEPDEPAKLIMESSF